MSEHAVLVEEQPSQHHMKHPTRYLPMNIWDWIGYSVDFLIAIRGIKQL